MIRVSGQFRPRSPKGRQRSRRQPGLESLEARLVLNGPDAADLGDFYRYSGQKVALNRALDQITVGLLPNTPTGRIDQLIAAGTPLAGYTAAKTGRAGVWTLTRTTAYSGDLQSRQRSIDLARSWAATQTGVDFAAPSYVIPDGGDRFSVTRDLVVALRPGVTPDTIFVGANYASYRNVRGTADQFVVTTTVQPGSAILNLSEALGKDSRVRWASADFLASRQAMSLNDPLIPQQWHLQNTGQNGGTPGADAHVVDAWNQGATGQGTLVAIIDTGMQLDHPDLAPNLWTNPGEVAGNGVDDDGNGYVDDIHGWDFIDNDNDPSPASGEFHATSVAGVAAGRGDNNLGGAGAAYLAQIMSVRVIGASVPLSAYAECIYYAGGRTANGAGQWNAAVVLNESYGGAGAIDVEGDAFLWAATQARGGKGVFNFAATGNSGGINDPGFVSYPAGYEGAIAVGGTTEKDVRVEYSQYGPHTWIVAPTGSFGFTDANGAAGIQNIVTTDITGGDGYDPGDYTGLFATGFNGTSSATPLVSGVAALIYSVNPTLTYEQMRQVLRETADKVGGVSYDSNGFNEQYGYGRINAAAAVEKYAVRLELSAPTGLVENTPSGQVELGRVVFATVPSDVASYTATVDWGDGNPASPATLSPRGGGRYAIVSDGIAYQEGGTYPVIVQINKPTGDSFSGTTTVAVASRPLAGTPLLINALPGGGSILEGDLYAGPVAEFSDTDPDAMTADNYTATIVWNDDQSTTIGQIHPLGDNRFEIVSDHVVGGGTSDVTITIVGPGGVTTTITSHTVAEDSKLHSVGIDTEPKEGSPLEDAIAFFIDDDPRNPPSSNYTAAINWGDGSSLEPGIVRSGNYVIGGQLRRGFFVYSSGAHVYDTRPTPYAVSVRVDNNTGDEFTQAGSSATVVDADLILDTFSYVLEGQTFLDFLGTFHDTDPRSHGPDRYGAEIDWDTSDADDTKVPVSVIVNTDGGFIVQGEHGYRLSGTYNYALRVFDKVGGGEGTTQSGSIAVPAATVNLSVTTPESPIEGQSFRGVIARFTTTNPNAIVDDFKASISWGDGTTTPLAAIRSVSEGVFEVLADDKTYSLLGAYPVSVHLLGELNPGTLQYAIDITAQNSIDVVDAPLNASGVSLPANLISKTDLAGLVVATFADTGPVSDLADFTATVNWGDGTTGPAVIVPNGPNRYIVQADHTFARPGALTPVVTITSRFGSVATATSQAVVQPKVTPVSGRLAASAGPASSQGVTALSKPTLVGNAEPGAVITLFASNGQGQPFVIGSAVADGSGVWATTLSQALSEGTFHLSASAVDSVGAPSNSSSLGTLVALPLGASGNPLIVDQTGPQVSRVAIDPRTGRVVVTLVDDGSGMLQSALANPSNYALSIVGRRINRALPLTGLSIGSAQAATLTFGNAGRLNKGTYTFQMRSAGLTDRAGNALDERFYIPFPGVYSKPGQNFIAEFSTDGTSTSPIRQYVPPPERIAARRFHERMIRLRRASR